MRVAVFGTGGVGGYFGTRLAAAGADVVFIARGAHLEAMRTSGLRLESVRGDILVHPAQASDSPTDVGRVDVVLLGVKTWQVAEAAEAMRPLLGPETIVVPLQNGVETPAFLAERLGEEQVVGGLCAAFSFIAGPGHIRHLGGGTIKFGELDNQKTMRIERLREAFARAGVPVDVPADIHVALWEKFMLVVPFGEVGAVTRAPIGVLMTVPETRKLIERGLEEIDAVARARAIPLSDDIVTRTLAVLDNTATPSGTSSLQRDIAAGQRSELDAWTGAVVRLGAAAGVATPLHAFLYASLLPLELRARGEVVFPN